MTPTSLDTRNTSLSRVDKLRQDASIASQLRALSEHPDVIALQVERVRSFVDIAVWVGIGLGLAFTMTNVQGFAASGAQAWSIGWLAAWLLDPMVSLVLVAVLRAEQVTARYQVDIGMWGHRTKIFAFIATYVMNTWTSWSQLHLSGIVLHSVPPVLIFCAAETAPTLRDRLTTAVLAAASNNIREPMEAVTSSPKKDESNDPAPVSGIEPAPSAKKAARKSVKSAKVKRHRVSYEEYLARAKAAFLPGIEPTPAWVREVTQCSRGLSSRIAAAVREQISIADLMPVHGMNLSTSELEEVA